jgi:hypothetical protein
MSAQLAAGLIGGLAGVLTALASSTITLLSVRWQTQQQSDEARRKHREDTRRDAYTSLVKAYVEYRAAWWILRQELGGAADPERCDELFEHTVATWREFSAKCSLVLVVGPKPVADAAEKLRDGAYAYDEPGVALYHAAKTGEPADAYQTAYDRARQRAEVGDFAQKAREAIDLQ